MTAQRMAVVRFSGGLGNQLFQLAHLLVLSAEGAQVRADLSWFRRHGRGTDRAPEIARLLEGVPRIGTLQGARIAAALRSRTRGRGPGDVVDRVGRAEIHTGYWQDAASVAGVRSALLDRLARISDLAPAVSPTSSHVAVHVRLGDYLRPEVAAFHGVTDARAQIALAEGIRAERGLQGITIFTDSPTRVEPLLSGSDLCTLSPAETAWQALAGMAAADTLVMSNSSLSWWAATIAGWRDTGPARVWMPRPWLAAPSDLDHRLASPGWSVYERVID